MKSLISVTPREFKRDFNEVMEMCTDMCMTTNQEIIIAVPTSRKSNTHAEIAKLVPVENGRGIKYEYDKELMDKYGINASNPKLSKIEAIMADAFEDEGVYSLISPEVKNRLAKAVEIAAKKLITMKFAKIRNVKSPVRGTGKAAGIDFFVPNFGSNKGFIVNPGTDVLIPSGIKMEIPEGYMLMAADKSGVVTSKWACLGAGRTPKAEAFESIVILGAKIVDEDYQGEIHIHVVNVGKAKAHIKPGMKIAQFILVPVSYEGLEEVSESELFSRSSERGDGALGSTGSY